MSLGIFVLVSAVASEATNTYLPNNTNIYYSPYAWNVEPTQAATINSAASVTLPTKFINHTHYNTHTGLPRTNPHKPQ